MKKEEILIHIKPIVIGSLAVIAGYLIFIAPQDSDLLNMMFLISLMGIVGVLVSLISGKNNLKTVISYAIIVYFIGFGIAYATLPGNTGLGTVFLLITPQFVGLYCLPAVIGSVVGHYLRKALKRP